MGLDLGEKSSRYCAIESVSRTRRCSDTSFISRVPAELRELEGANQSPHVKARSGERRNCRPESIPFLRNGMRAIQRSVRYGSGTWERVIPFFAYPAEIRRIVYTSNAVESLNLSLRTIIKARGSSPSDCSWP